MLSNMLSQYLGSFLLLILTLGQSSRAALVNPNYNETSETNKYCSQPHICDAFTNSHCVPLTRNGVSLFQCLCSDDPLLKLDHVQYIGAQRLRMESCSVANVCSKPQFGCVDPLAVCHMVVEKDSTGRLKERTFCTCPETGLTLANRKLYCDGDHHRDDETHNQYCKQPDICKSFPFSKCVPKKVNNILELFECLCEGPDYLQLEHTKYEGSQRLRMQTCSVKNLCQYSKYKCADPSATCHYTIEKFGTKFTPLTFCTCPQTELTLASRHLQCNETCYGKCSFASSCTINENDPDVIVCNCLAGWKGAKCDVPV